MQGQGEEQEQLSTTSPLIDQASSAWTGADKISVNVNTKQITKDSLIILAMLILVMMVSSFLKKSL
jgi:hypothetical protein